MTRGIACLIAAQFVSGLADNALLIVAMARLADMGRSAWLAPLLKAVFTLAYVLLAPWGRPLAQGAGDAGRQRAEGAGPRADGAGD